MASTGELQNELWGLEISPAFLGILTQPYLDQALKELADINGIVSQVANTEVQAKG